MSGKSVGAEWGGDNSNGHRGYAQARHGAKKFARSRRRFHENAAARQLALAIAGDPADSI